MWAWYQAKNVRGVLYEISAAEAQKPENKEKFEAEAKRMSDDKKEIIPYLTSNYQLVAAADQYFEGYMFSYYLFGKKDLGPF